MTVDAFVASGATALSLALVFLWLMITEQIIPKGRLLDAQKQITDLKSALAEALSVIKQQNDGVQPLLITVRELVNDIKLVLIRRTR